MAFILTSSIIVENLHLKRRIGTKNMTDRRIYHLLNKLLILILFIIVVYSIFTAYCPVKNLHYSIQSHKYETKMKTHQTNHHEQVGMWDIYIIIGI